MSHLVKFTLVLTVVMGASTARAQEAASADVTPSSVSDPVVRSAPASPSEAPPTFDPSAWSPMDPVPLDYHSEKHARRGLVAGGITLFALSYGVSVVTGGVLAAMLSGSSRGDNGFNCSPNPCSVAPTIPFFLPGIGPFIIAGESGTGALTAMAIADGLVQLGGIAMIAYGLAVPTTQLVRDKSASSFTMTPTPVFGNGRAGMGLVGTF